MQNITKNDIHEAKSEDQKNSIIKKIMNTKHEIKLYKINMYNVHITLWMNRDNIMKHQFEFCISEWCWRHKQIKSLVCQI